jgi:hypothetical protein
MGRIKEVIEMSSITRKAVLTAVFTACLGGLGARAFAQDMLIANVPFTFTAAGRTYGPGKYELQVDSQAQVIGLFGPARNSGMAEVLTRLGGQAASATEGRLVFDNVDGVYVLSEMWLPHEDGYLLHDTPSPHTHSVVSIRTSRN